MAQPKWVVLKAVPHENYTIELSFTDGTQGTFDMAPLLKEDYYASLAAIPIFMTGHAECGTVVWENDMDIAPKHLYDNCR